MSFFAKIKKYSIIAVVTALITGILFLVFPSQCIDFLSLAVGFALILFGIYGIFDYIAKATSSFNLYLGIIVTICGIVVCFKYKQILSFMVVVLGIFILSTGIVNLIASIKVVASNPFSGWLTLFMSVVTCVFGVIAITKSSSTTVGIVQLMGAALLIYAIIDIVIYFQIKRSINQAIVDASALNTDGVVIESVDEED